MKQERAIFDRVASRAGMREGMARAINHANPDWAREAYLALFKTAHHFEFFTSDLVVKIIPDTVNTHEWRAMGPIMRAGQTMGWIEKANILAIPSDRNTLHRSPLTVWHSLIHRRSGLRIIRIVQ